MDFSLTEAERDLVGPLPRLRPEGDRHRAPRRRGRRPAARPTCSARWASSACSACSSPRSGAASACRRSASSPPWSRSAWPTSRWPRRGRPTSRSGRCRCYLFGNDEQRERWLRPLAEGRALGAFGLTEPDAGSDARGIRTRAERRDGGWLINGRKTFISNAGTDMSFGVTLLARTTATTTTVRHASSSRRTRPASPWARRCGASAGRASTPASCSSTTCGCPTTTSSAIPNLGLGQFLRTLEVGRISIAALSLSLTQAVLDLATRLRQAARAVRPADLEVPGRPVQAGRHRHRARGGPLAHLPRRLPARHRPAVP